MLSSKIINSSTEQLKTLIDNFGNTIVDITEPINFFIKCCNPTSIALLNLIKNRRYDSNSLKTFLKTHMSHIDNPTLITMYELFPDVFTEDVLKNCNKNFRDFVNGKCERFLDILCYGRTEIFYQKLEVIIRNETPTDDNFIIAASCYKKSLELLIIYNKNRITSNLLSRVIADEKVPLETVEYVISKAHEIKDYDEIANAFISRFGGFSTQNVNLIGVIDKKSKFDTLMNLIAENDLADVFQTLKSSGFLDLTSAELVRMFCKKKAPGCLRVTLKAFDAVLTHDDVLNCFKEEGFYCLKMAVSHRAIADPTKLLDLQMDNNLFEFIRSVYREVDSSQLTNESIIISIKITEVIKENYKFSDLDDRILPKEVSERADELYDLLEDSININLPKKIYELEMYLAILKHYRKYIYSYDIESILRSSDLSSIILNDSQSLLELLRYEKDLVCDSS